MDVGRIQFAGSADDGGSAMHLGAQADALAEEVVGFARLPHRGKCWILNSSH
jgi:hypothetical protein